VINGATDSVITTIPAGGGSWVLVWNSTNNKVYSANQGGDNVTVINGASDSVITTVPAGDHPWALCYNSTNNKVYCANAYSNTVTVIDGVTDSVITTITVGSWPYALFHNSLNNKVYCANGGGNDVTIIDGVTDSVIKTITVGGSPGAFAWNPIENRVYVANYWSNTVSVLRDSIPVGIEEREIASLPLAMTKGVEIYPNPAKAVIFVRFQFVGATSQSRQSGLGNPSYNKEEKNFKIFDVSGKMIKEIEILPLHSAQGQNDRAGEVQISLKGINPGIYFLRLGTETKKFLIVK